jgi:hypothetical protein
MNGDTFCLMQGRGDPRRGKDEIRPEHNKGNYLQAVVNDAVQWFKPYAKHIALIGYGNHETSVIRNVEFDALQMFVTLLNHECGSYVQLGGYGGAILFGFAHSPNTTHYTRFAMHYFHGSGGGGVVTKGVIQLHDEATASASNTHCDVQRRICRRSGWLPRRKGQTSEAARWLLDEVAVGEDCK